MVLGLPIMGPASEGCSSLQVQGMVLEYNNIYVQRWGCSSLQVQGMVLDFLPFLL